jgi:protein-disulfide isomerase
MSEPYTLDVPVNPTDHVIGPQTARVAVVEYGDFECPNCKQAYQAMKIVLKHFEHRIRFVFRHFPLIEVHPHAQLAAEAAESAAAQHKFWPMHDMLFDHRDHLKAHDLHAYAQSLELDLQRFDHELGDQVYRQRVNEHVAGGRRSGVHGTPTFFVDGALVDVSFGMERLMQAIDAGLRAHP